MRESNFEGLRILAIFYIVLYHQIVFWIAPVQQDIIFWQAIQPTLHVGVLLFVLISGYFGIRTTSKGILTLLLLSAIFYIPCEIFYKLLCGSTKSFVECLLPLSKGPYWFLRTYLWLYLVAPVVNKFIRQNCKINACYLAAVTGIVSTWMFVSGIDPSLVGGKNIVNFVFLYTLGYLIRQHKNKLLKISFYKPLGIYILLNLGLICTYSFFGNVRLCRYLFQYFFEYDSLFVVLNSFLLFWCFMYRPYKSKYINNFAKGIFAVYIIESCDAVRFTLTIPMSKHILSLGDTFDIFLCLIIESVAIIVVCILAYRIVSPIIDALCSCFCRCKTLKEFDGIIDKLH